MNNIVKKIIIQGLFDIRDYEIEIKDNFLIIIGENGSGKTTVFRIIYYLFSTNWDELKKFQFSKITIIFADNKEVIINSDLIKRINLSFEKFEFYFEKNTRNKEFINYILDYYNLYVTEAREDFEREIIFTDLNRFFPKDYIEKLFHQDEFMSLHDIDKNIKNYFKPISLYLPTYRRIEEEFRTIFPNVEIKKRRKSNSRSLELIEFGMDDVEQLVKRKKDELKKDSQEKQNKLTLGYLGEVVDQNYNKVDFNAITNLREDEIEAVLKRIEDTILSDTQKQSIRDTILKVKNEKIHGDPQSRLICHYFLQLLKFHQEIEKEESSFIKFCYICNQYLEANRIFYDSATFECQVYNRVDGDYKKEHIIDFQKLSSGEKQIVSIFSHLNLSQEMYFVFIDEPELSLSVEWQKTFLPDIVESTNCAGLIATTHSPFVFENKLEPYVHGINEFCIRG